MKKSERIKRLEGDLVSAGMFHLRLTVERDQARAKRDQLREELAEMTAARDRLQLAVWENKAEVARLTSELAKAGGA